MKNTATLTPSQAGVLAVRGLAAQAGSAVRRTVPGVVLGGSAAPAAGTGLPTAVRLRVPAFDVPMTGARATTVRLTGLSIDDGRPAVTSDTTTSATSTTPGDLPPREPPS